MATHTNITPTHTTVHHHTLNIYTIAEWYKNGHQAVAKLITKHSHSSVRAIWPVVCSFICFELESDL